MDSISDYGILGYGVDIIENQPLQPVIGLTYDQGQTFTFRRPLLIPDQFRFDPSPQHTMSEQRVSGVMQTARDYQRCLSVECGLGGEVDGVEFSGEARSVNSLFERRSSTAVHQYVSSRADYQILGLDGTGLRHAVLPAVRDAARAVLDGSGRFADFFTEYGTHVVAKAVIGGQLKVNTDLTLNVDASKHMSRAGVDIGGQAKSEALGYASGRFAFDTRSSTSDATYRSCSNVSVSLLGGDIAARDFDAWRASLNDSEIFSHAVGAPAAQRSAQPTPDSGARHYLALVNPRYVALHTLLGLNDADRARFEAALKQHLSGRNPFDEQVHRLDPAVPESQAIEQGQQHRFSMRGWMATYETCAGLLARPGAYAVVQCKSDAEPGGWTEKTVYAGETVTLRGKTPYMSGYMDVKFVQLHGDDGDARVYARNRLVSW